MLSNNKKEFCSMINECQPVDIMICLLTAHDKSKCPYYHKILREKFNLQTHNTSRYKKECRKKINFVIIERKEYEVKGKKINCVLVRYGKEKE